MSTSTSTTVGSLLLAAAFATIGAIAITRLGGDVSPNGQAMKPVAIAAAQVQWTASAPGRVEARDGEVRISAQTPGRIVEIAVKANDVVKTGDMLIQLDDTDARSRVAAAEAEASVRKRERDTDTSGNKLAQDRRQAEDAAYSAEQAYYSARAELDHAMHDLRMGKPGATTAAVDKARAAMKDAETKLDTNRIALRKAQTTQNVPLPTRLETGLTQARVEVTLAETAFERTRIRAPGDGTILQISPRVGELAAASPEQTLVVMGDLSTMRVRAEVEERDVAKVRVGQTVIVRSDAYPGREFTGKVASRAKMVAHGKLGQRGPRRPTDIDTLEVIVDMNAAPELLPGMRVDAFFKAEDAGKSDKAADARPIGAAKN